MTLNTYFIIIIKNQRSMKPQACLAITQTNFIAKHVGCKHVSH